ncbi:MAG: hypothetical protein ACT4OO_14315, partial [Nitrospiraceae bacterium]
MSCVVFKAVGFFLVLTLSSCDLSSSSDRGRNQASETLHYFTWSDYAGPELLAEFERQAGVKIIVDTFSSNEEMLAKLQSGATGYDVVV